LPRRWSKDSVVIIAWSQRNAPLSVGSLLRSSYLLYFSQPATDRPLLQAIHRQPIRSIVELGLDINGRTQRLLEVVGWHNANQPLRYTAIDQFEARPKIQPALSLKQAFAALRGTHLRLQLVPGDPATALARVANLLARTDLLIISSCLDQESLARAWAWIPRMLTDSSLIFIEQPHPKTNLTQWRRLKLAEVERLAAVASQVRRRAA
jgi:hypothetical protein